VISIGVGEFYSFLFPVLSPDPGSVDWPRLTKGKVILFWAAVGVFCVNKSYSSKAIGSTIPNFAVLMACKTIRSWVVYGTT